MATQQKIDKRRKLTPQQEEEIVMLHQNALKPNGKAYTLRDIADRFNITPEWVRKVVAKNGVAVTGTSARQLRNNPESREQFLAMIRSGVSINVAAGTYGLTIKGFQELCDQDEEFTIAVQKARYDNLARKELVVSQEGDENANMALTILERAKETKNLWREERVENKSGVNIVMSWDREPSTVTIDHDEE